MVRTPAFQAVNPGSIPGRVTKGKSVKLHTMADMDKPPLPVGDVSSDKKTIHEGLTLEEISNLFSVSRERIREIEAKAIRKLAQPSRSKILSAYKSVVDRG